MRTIMTAFLVVSFCLPLMGDEQKDFQPTKAKAEKGDAFAQVALGAMYAKGDGVPKDVREAAKWYLIPAGQGYPEAQYSLGRLYADDHGILKDTREAVKWYRNAAEQGYAEAQYSLGAIYDDGREVPEDDKEAAKWYRKAAEQGYAEAQYNLGQLYGKGAGVPKNDGEAFKWHYKAAEQGHGRSQFELGMRYTRGEGVPRDIVTGYAWFNIVAALNSNKDKALFSYTLLAKSQKNTWARQMTPEQITLAQELSKEMIKNDPKGLNYNKAFELTNASAEKGYVEALRHMYSNSKELGFKSPIATKLQQSP